MKSSFSLLSELSIASLRLKSQHSQVELTAKPTVKLTVEPTVETTINIH